MVICTMVYEVAWMIAPTVNRIEANHIVDRRPNLSASIPAIIAPTNPPAEVIDVMSSFSESDMRRPSRSDPITTNTPLMTPLCSVNQYPNRFDWVMSAALRIVTV